jgi:hypothetical protein
MNTIPRASSTLRYFEERLAEGFFARHETFCPRYGWLKKGFDGVTKDPYIFERPDAIERLGVGKNMVRAIRFWCIAFHLIEPDIESGPRRLAGRMRVTPFGSALLADDGWDPFLEDPASLWLLHWHLFSPPISAVTWSMAINLGHIGSFTLKELSQVLMEHKNSYSALPRCSDSSILKDASCFIRMYASPERQVSDEIECPFTDLGLLIPDDEKQAFRFNMSDKSRLPEEIFWAACFDYSHITQSASKTLSLNKTTYEFNSPGVVFKLSETDIGYRLERASRKFGEKVLFDEQYGNRQLFFESDAKSLYWQALHQYYGGQAGTRFIQ